MKEEIIKAFLELNEDANKNWQNEKILSLCNYDDKNGEIKLTVSIGRNDTTYHDLLVEDDGIRIVQQSKENNLLDDVIHYVLNPIFYGTKA